MKDSDDINYYASWLRAIAMALVILFSMHSLPLPNASSAICAYAYAENNKSGCDDCRKTGERVSAFCSFKYLILFFWYASMSVALVVVLVMDIATGFSQRFTTSFIEWFRDADAGLEKFFKKLRC